MTTMLRASLLSKGVDLARKSAQRAALTVAGRRAIIALEEGFAPAPTSLEGPNCCIRPCGSIPTRMIPGDRKLLARALGQY